ncbi:hypothetical protein DACRYDRAFT_23952 [Dacryopinax primogenitus]|uniref:Uncharacterized protein n=1 Tax=Dacryopinax primogenitus (strain DJM 731) TaxID=1858805 RepID=M5FV16_DACPD|nr:uncharacterized protein DACRYDRAFT_23952 [Dacryopinax primogenitus]EJT99414.1 hypothetical protein DACRYDRAFT_23952 [Dacryopinax primogenitus]
MIPWASWWDRTRVLDHTHNPRGYVVYTHGYRYVTSREFLPHPPPAGTLITADLVWTRVTVMDFNPRMTKWIMAEREKRRERARSEQAARARAEASGANGESVAERGVTGLNAETAESGSHSQLDGGGMEMDEVLSEWGQLHEDEDEDGNDDDDDDEDDDDMEDVDEEEKEEDDLLSDEDEDEDDDHQAVVPGDAAGPGSAGPGPDELQIISESLSPTSASATPRLPAFEHLVTRPYPILPQNVFVERVCSGLPMIMRHLEVPGMFQGLFIDGERVLALVEREGREVLKVNVF